MKVIRVFSAFIKIMLIAMLLAGLASCASTASAWNSLTGPLQTNKEQPSVPQVQLNFALPEDVRNEPITLKSVGVAGNCSTVGNCQSTPSQNNPVFGSSD